MFFKIIILAPVFYFLAVLQNSFLAHFSLLGITPNLIFITVIFLIFWGSSRFEWAIAGALTGGFFLDVFSRSFLGFNILIMLGIAVFTKLILKRYVQIPA